MRTDPCAEEVRGIVERVFSKLLHKEGQPPEPPAYALEGRFGGRFAEMGGGRTHRPRVRGARCLLPWRTALGECLLP